jgi:adenylate cyclase
LLNFNFKQEDLSGISFKSINEFGELALKSPEKLKGPFKESFTTIQNTIKGKVVLVGLTFTANGDIGATSLEDHVSLVNVHAAAISEILTGNHLDRASDKIMALTLLLLILIIGIGGLTLSIKDLSILFAMVLILIISVNFSGLYWNWVYFPVIYLGAFTSVLYLAIVLFRYVTEEKEKIRIRAMFSTMVSSSVLDYMESNPGSFSLSGSRMPATIMFSDVAGFTTISEGLTPEKLVLLLNKYLTPMTDIILEANGYVDKYEGDAIMAEWGVPFANDRHATLACWAVLDQLKKLDEIREDLYKEFGYRLTVRMGVNSGEVSAGNMGSNSRFSYTVMGDAVNLAARLEPTNKVYGTTAMIGENTYELAKDDIEVRRLDKVVVVGKKESIKVYELIAKKGEIDERRKKLIGHYEKGLDLHEQRLWNEAIAEFQEALKVDPDDYASQVLIDRIKEYKLTPPADSWQGEFIRKSKD